MEDKECVITYHDETGLHKVSQEELERIKNYAKDQGIVSGTIRRIGDYIGIVVRKYTKGGKYEKWCESRRIETRDREHLASVRQDNKGGRKS